MRGGEDAEWRPCSLFGAALAMLVSFILPSDLLAQAVATASGPGSYVAVGGGISVFQVDYGQRVVGGGWVFADVNPTWRFGLEAEARWLRFHAGEDVTETNYLAGVRVAIRSHAVKPYAKFLVGDAHIVLPFQYASGDFVAYVPGGGLDYELGDRVSVRAVDFEYQLWPQFPYGELKPYGVSTGLIFRLNGVDRLPRSARRYRQ
jgi:hypothetical protein